MASEHAASSVNTVPTAEPSAAQKLQQMHATVEDADEEDQPTRSANETNSSWAAPMSSKAAGKQKVSANSKGLDTQSHELFPELAGPKGKSANVAPVWGAKSAANGNGDAAVSHGISRSSTPASGAATPQSSAPSMFIPGRNVESVTLEPQFLIPRNQLRRPIPDIIKDINRKSRANITMATSNNGRLKFDATGPQDLAQQALKDLVQQIGSRVRKPPLHTRSRPIQS